MTEDKDKTVDDRMKWSEAVSVIDAVIEGFIGESDMSELCRSQMVSNSVLMVNLIDKAWERIQQG